MKERERETVSFTVRWTRGMNDEADGDEGEATTSRKDEVGEAKRTRERMAEKGHWVDSWTLEFADDTSGVLVADNEDILQDAINIMSDLFEEFFNAIGMCLNAKKSELIIFRSSKKQRTLCLPSGQEESKVVRLLGLWIDNGYRFDVHTQKVLQKVRFKLANLSKVRPYMSEERAKLVVEALIHSTINYMGIIYLRLPSNKVKVQRLLNRAARLVLRAEPRAHVEDLLRELYWLNVENMQRYLMVTSFRRLKYGNCRAKISYANLFEGNLGLYRLRAVHTRVQWTRINAHGRNAYIYQASHLYNELELNGALFLSEEAFKESAKFRVFRDYYNGNL